MRLFKINNKITEVIYRLDLLLKIKIYPVYYIAILELVHGDYKLLIEVKSKTNSQLRKYLSIIRQIVSYFIKFNKKDIKNYIKTKGEFRKFYRKGIGVLLKNILGNIKKKVKSNRIN